MTQAVRFCIRAPHLSAAFIALASMAVIYWVLFDTLHIERRLAHFTAPQMLEIKDQSLSLQDEAFGDKDLLPIYGSSELRNDSPYAGRIFFSQYPTGFRLFTVGKAGSKTLIIAERIGALGEKVRGKKVVIILSPTWFLARQEARSSYRGNFSALQAEELIFNSPLSQSLKADLAREMLKYSKTLAGHPLLRFELKRLAGMHHSIEDRLVMELGKSEDGFLALLDRLETTFALSGQMIENVPQLPDVHRHAKTTENWDALVGKAAITSNPEGWESEKDSGGIKLGRKLRGEHNASFPAMIDRTDEWKHLVLLMRTLRELGAKPLFINIPLNANAFEEAGVTPEQLKYYYARLRNTVRDFHYPLATFEKYQGDSHFFADSLGHPSAKGWMVFNRTINQFYHGKLPPTLD